MPVPLSPSQAARQHALAPWRLDPVGDFHCEELSTTLRPLYSADGLILGWVDMLPWGDMDANAALIAAAPELLAALKGALLVIGTKPSDTYTAAVSEDIQAAIAKARGVAS